MVLELLYMGLMITIGLIVFFKAIIKLIQTMRIGGV